ncbi:hypothetical protein K503DRAFT_783909 [Rhizopogon vinicolor AM-OR11-026]|uniref:Uncharacterized protein n=1 Tax=Rhizopogon vinicolor AM-OR11-026 TaxID=1314800 RepID=A0A1B7MWV1_9AGAM|nr:hypothetical protein K503DRAFT_783909 [Rhizopogon vinicolor AM-OR11-026]
MYGAHDARIVRKLKATVPLLHQLTLTIHHFSHSYYTEILSTFGGHEDSIIAIATFPYGEKIATESFDRTIRIWRVEDGTELKNSEGPKPDVHNLLFQHYQWQLWALYGTQPPGRGKVIISIVTHPSIFSAQETWSVATDKDIQIWGLDRRERLSNINDTLYLSLTWTRGRAHLLSATSASRDGTIRLLQLPTGTEVARYEHSSDNIRVVLSVDGRFTVLGWPFSILAHGYRNYVLPSPNARERQGKYGDEMCILYEQLAAMRANGPVIWI